ncbi:hypothetical protein PAHAL_2G226100 [Panicum hallii]|uniref:Uncharacterized protein n=1 Tax=Panicum hallii TaxID=206008 RepID=A0A2T8KQ02_9POAL|nr:hypothetical protein PAHAL_2G226100 [Panicum hallii]
MLGQHPTSPTSGPRANGCPGSGRPLPVTSDSPPIRQPPSPLTPGPTCVATLLSVSESICWPAHYWPQASLAVIKGY